MGIIQKPDSARPAVEATGDRAVIWGDVDLSQLPARQLTELSEPRSHGFQVIIRQSALNRLHHHGDATPKVEICGVLVGNLYRDHAGHYLLIEQIIEGQSATGSVGQVTFTADTWQHIQSTMDGTYPSLRIVGWYHTHPGHGIFLSEMDIFLHESFFGQPWQAALVYDPQSGEEGIFHGEAGAVARSKYLIDADEAAVPIASQARQAKAAAPAVLAAPRAKGHFFGHLRRFFLAMFGLALFAAMGILIGAFILQMHIEIPPWLVRMAHDALRG